MYLKFTDRSLNIYMTHRKRKMTTTTVKFSSQAAEEEEPNKNSWVHVNDAASTTIVDGEKVSELYLRIHNLHGCQEFHLEEVEDWINTHHPNNDINWSATKMYVKHIEYWSR